MNPEQALTRIEHAIANRQRSLTDKWYLTYIDGSFVCIPTDKNPPPFPLFDTFTDDDARHGFSAQRWSCIKARVAITIAIGGQL